MNQDPIGYQVLKRLDTWTESLFLELVENAAGEEFEMLTLGVSKELHPLLLRLYRNEILPRLKQQIQCVKMPLEAFHFGEKSTIQIIYPYSEGFVELSNKETSVASFAQLAAGLFELKKLNVDGFYSLRDQFSELSTLNR